MRTLLPCVSEGGRILFACLCYGIPIYLEFPYQTSRIEESIYDMVY